VQEFSKAIGFDVETLNYTLGMFLCYPLGFIMLMLPYGRVRHLFSFILGAFLLQFTLGVQWIHQLITSLLVYVMFLVLPRKAAMYSVPVVVMIYMTLGHLHRQYINYLGWDLDFTGAQMVLTQKLYMLAFNLYDGHQLSRGKDDRASKKCAQFALNKVPGLLEYLGYTFCFSSVLAGPATEFTTYCASCDGSLLYTSDGKPRGKIPSNFWPTLRPFLISLINLGIFVFLGAHFSMLDAVDPKGNLPNVIKPDFLEKPWAYRFYYLWMALVVVRQKYYFAWKSAEGANNIWYAGFEGFDDKGNPKGWENSINIDILEFETAPNIQILSKEWNKKTSLWLTRYVYIRTNGSLIAVYCMSSFWHGFYPGYYLFFLSVPLLTFCERAGRKKISPYFSASKWTPYGIICIIATSFCAEYLVAPFALLAFDRSWACWKSHYFFVHIGCILFLLLVPRLPTPKTKTS
jgi:hypothetical protein